MKTLDSSILSLIILGVIYVNLHIRSDKKQLLHRLFMMLIILNMVLIFIDIFSWVFDGRPGMMNYILNCVFNLSLYLIEPLAAIIWLLYANLQIFHDEHRLTKILWPCSVIFLTNAVLSVASLYTRWYFYVTPNNLYHRGNYYGVHVLICFGMLFYSYLFIIWNRNRLSKSNYYAMIFFAIPPVIGGVIQALFYGVSLSMSSMMLSLLIAFIYIQDQSVKTDYLTGLYNRRQLDYYLKKKIRESTSYKSFSVILIDFNDFKQINDALGHDVGDDALRQTVNIIKSCLRKEDFMARYGGDEFFVILDFSDRHLLESTVNRIRQSIETFNSLNDNSYKISVSMGYDIYRFEEKLNYVNFLKHLDILMYKNKEHVKAPQN